MKRIKELHQQAMQWAEQALLARINGDPRKSQSLLKKAFAAESEAASLCGHELEPTRSILHRSAASIALQVNRPRDAEQMIAAGLAGNPHDEIANELRDLMEQVWFERHLELKGLTLDAREIQLSIAGKAVGHGMIESPEFLSRAQALERMITRTAQRKLEMPYQETSYQKKDFKEQFEVCYSVPRAASFAISIRVGKPCEQGMLFQDAEQLAVDVIDEVVDALSQMNDGKSEAVLARIQDPAYRRNFQALARKFAPDGTNVTLVGLTVMRNDEAKNVKITQPILGAKREATANANGKYVAARGYLKYASAVKEKNEIRVVADDGKLTRFIVPEGMMNDIVRPLWDNRVIAEGYRQGEVVQLESIRESVDQ